MLGNVCVHKALSSKTDLHSLRQGQEIQAQQPSQSEGMVSREGCWEVRLLLSYGDSGKGAEVSASPVRLEQSGFCLQSYS